MQVMEASDNGDSSILDNDATIHRSPWVVSKATEDKCRMQRQGFTHS